MNIQYGLKNRLTFFGFGLLLITIGNALSIISDTGSGVWTAASINLSQATQLPIKWTLLFVGTLIILLNQLLSKGVRLYHLLGELIFVFFFSNFIQFFVELLQLTEIPGRSFSFRVIVSIFGVILTCIGTSIYQRANIVLYPTDGLTNSVRQRITNNSIVFAQGLVFLIPIVVIAASAYFNHHIYGVQVVTIFSCISNGTIIGISDKYIFPTLIHHMRYQLPNEANITADS